MTFLYRFYNIFKVFLFVFFWENAISNSVYMFAPLFMISFICLFLNIFFNLILFNLLYNFPHFNFISYYKFSTSIVFRTLYNVLLCFCVWPLNGSTKIFVTFFMTRRSTNWPLLTFSVKIYLVRAAISL